MSALHPLADFVITTEDSTAFASASGDFNPLHLDATAARRSQFGQTLIHGICGTLRALDLYLEQVDTPVALASLRVRFPRPITQGQAISLQVSPEESGARLELVCGGIRRQIIELRFAPRPEPVAAPAYPGTAQRRSADVLDISHCQGLSGEVPLRWAGEVLAALFPHASRRLPPDQLSTVLAATDIVGMRCPGLHSVFSRLDLDFKDGDGANDRLRYRVVTADERIDRVELEVANAFARGRIEAFFRAPPVRQPDYATIRRGVAPDTFGEQRALVIGGSRGLGEVIAKTLAAGGADVLLTYASGREDAERVAGDINAGGGSAATSHYDVLAADPSAELGSLGLTVTHLYYLASPVIEKGENARWDHALFGRYCDYYLRGFAPLVEHLSAERDADNLLHVFAPSSIYLDQRPRGFREYVAAKSAMESYVAGLTAGRSDLLVAVPRLPQLYTDQTSGVRGARDSDTPGLILQVLQEAFAAR